MAEIASAYLSILPSFKGGASGITKQVQGPITSSGTTLGRSFGKMFVLGAGVIAAAGIGSLLKGSIDEAREAQKVGAATEAIIKATGGAAGITADQVGKMAGRLSAVTGIDDEVIQSGSNLLLTFKNVKNYVDGQFVGTFDRATASAVDLSAAGFGSVESASKTLGKALNDPVKGVSALSRAGVTFSEQQKKQIANFVETGNVAKAQNLILNEVESQVGGVAKATATSGEKASVALGNLKEQIGTALLPIIDRLADVFTTRIAPAISTFVENLQNGKGSVAGFGAFIRDNVLPILASLASFIGEKLPPIVARLSDVFQVYILPTLKQFAGYVQTTVVPILRDYLGNVIAGLRDAFDKIAAAIKRNEPELRQLLTGLKNVGKFVIEKILPILGKLVGFLYKNLGTSIGATIDTIGELVRNFNSAKERISNFVSGASNAITKFRNAVAKGLGAVVNFFRKIPSQIKGFLKGLPEDLKRIGGDIVDGLKRGISAAWHFVTDEVQRLIGLIPKKIRQLMGIASPSKVTHYLGEMIGQGLADGISAKTKKVDEATKKMLEKLKSRLESVKSDFASLADSVSGAFTGNLFEAETAGDFVSNLLGTKGQLTALKAAFKKLIGYGLKPEFLSQLFQSGNGGLILDLAAGTKAQAQQANSLFGDVSSLSSSLGTSVADAKFGDKLDGIRQEIRELRKDQKGNADRTGERVGREINRSARAGYRRGLAA